MKDINAQVELLGLEAENAFGKNKWDLLTNQKSLLLENRTQAAINLNDANANLVDMQAGTGLSGKTYQDLLDIIATEEEGSDAYNDAAAVIAAWDLVAEKEQEYYEAANAVIDKQLELVKDQYDTNKDFKDTLKEWSNTLLNYNRVKGSGLGMFSDSSVNESLAMAIANIAIADYANDSTISTFTNALLMTFLIQSYKICHIIRLIHTTNIMDKIIFSFLTILIYPHTVKGLIVSIRNLI
jgi:hypothetical protein